MGSRLEANAEASRKRIASHRFEDEDGDEYAGSAFGGFTDYFRRKKLKLQNLDADMRARSADRPPIFKGVVAHVNGYTQPSLSDLHVLIVQHGGGFLQYLDGKTAATHIIASSLTPKKVVEFRRYRIVKPAWVVDSIAAGKLLPWSEYRVVDEGDTQKVLAFGDGKIVSQANVKARGYKDQTDASWYTGQLRDTPAATPRGTPGSARPSRFLKQRLPSPDEAVDDIEDLPALHPPELTSSGGKTLDVEEERILQSRTLVTPPKTSPSLAPQRDRDDIDRDGCNSLVAEPARAPLDEKQGGRADPDTVQSPRKKVHLTAEEHNAILLRDPNVRKSTVVDPNFLEQYYRESRLHHLSTWKADLKAQLQALASEKTSSQQNKHKRPPGARRYILHVDFDSFFAAVSLKKHPQWKEKPAVVAHGNGSGSEIASCNYPARRFGVKNGMWMKRAQELCPELKVLPYDFPAYEETSRAFYDAILATDGIVQSVSIDEALIDVSSQCIAVGGSDGKRMSEGSIYREQAKAEEIALSLREEVKKRTDCNVSVGMGGNILLAKVALRKAKPAGQYQIKPEEVLSFIGELQVQDLPGVAWSIGGKLEEIGIKFVKDIREFTKEKLVQTLGPKTGEKLWEYARGIDKTEVGEQVVRKSVSAEVNWGVRFENQEQADDFIGSLCGELQKRLLKERVKGKQFTMKIMRRSPDAPLDPPKHLGHGKCDTFNRSLVLGVATNSKEVLTKEALSILRGFGFSPGELRGIGVQMTKLEPMKSATDGSLEGSQRRLQFKVNNEEPNSARKPPQVVEADPIQDDPETPKKPRSGTAEHVAFGAPELNQSTPSRRPLNTLGTQFILPTQFDPKVLADLPEDIRSKLLRQTRQASPTPSARNSRDPSPTTPSHRLHRPFALTALPAQSQLDPDILESLPADVRADVLAQYAASATPGSPSRTPRRKHADQTLLPQSPRKNRIIGIPAKGPIVPAIKRGRGRPPKSAQLAAAAQATAKSITGQTLKQANFIFARPNAPPVAAPVGAHVAAPVETPAAAPAAAPIAHDDTVTESIESESKGTPPSGPDTTVLAGLPPELHHEVLEEHKSEKLRAQCLAVNANHPLLHEKPADVPIPTHIDNVSGARTPTFTERKLSRAGDLRNALKQWITEFKDEAPYGDDTDALGRYLKSVVGEERDLAKATGLVKWVIWVVGDVVQERVVEQWGETVEELRNVVNEAARERGIGPINFS